MNDVQEILTSKRTSVDTAAKIFKELDPVDIDFMLGRWQGFEIATGHPIDGLLDASGWYGKDFVSLEEVHPLLVRGLGKNRLYPLNPGLVPLSWPLPRVKILRTLVGLLEPVYRTRKYRARLRMMQYKGKLTATMVYDQKPINDHFAMIDQNTVLGLMDWKGCDQPYVFVLERESG
jgi:hypothetical protein